MAKCCKTQSNIVKTQTNIVKHLKTFEYLVGHIVETQSSIVKTQINMAKQSKSAQLEMQYKTNSTDRKLMKTGRNLENKEIFVLKSNVKLKYCILKPSAKTLVQMSFGKQSNHLLRTKGIVHQKTIC